MLLWKKAQSEQASYTEPRIIAAAPYETLLMPDRTNDELLSELGDLAVLHTKAHKHVIGIHLAGLALYLLGFAIAIPAFLGIPSHPIWPYHLLCLLGSVAIVPAGCAVGLRVGRAFYTQSRERLAGLLAALAQRREARAVPVLLEIMDLRTSGAIMWKKSRPILLDALELLLAGITPDEFQTLSRQQMRDIVTMLYFPDGSLRQVTVDAIIRCGDSRTLEPLKQLHRLRSFALSAENNPICRWNPLLRYLQKEGVPRASEAGNRAITTAMAGLTERLDAERRTAQLLRPVDNTDALVAQELLRAAAPVGASTPSEDLVRAAPADPGGDG